MDERERMLAQGPRVAPDAQTAPPAAAVDATRMPVLVAQSGGRNRRRVRRLLPLVAAAFFLLEGRFSWASEDYLIWALIAVAAGIAVVEPRRTKGN